MLCFICSYTAVLISTVPCWVALKSGGVDIWIAVSVLAACLPAIGIGCGPGAAYPSPPDPAYQRRRWGYLPEWCFEGGVSEAVWARPHRDRPSLNWVRGQNPVL